MPAPKPSSLPWRRQVAISFPCCLAHRHRHVDGAFGRIRAGHRIVEKHHDAVTRELVECPLELGHKRPQRAVILAQELKNFLRLCGLSKGGVAAQIAEYDYDLAAVALQDSLVSLRDNKFGKLRCEKALQPSHPSQLLDLLGYARLQFAVPSSDLIAAVAKLGQ